MGDFGSSGFLIIILGFVSLSLYFLPAIAGRKKRNFAAIFWLNFLLGWSVAGWIVALIWALTKDSEAPQAVVSQPMSASALCAHCGKYSPSGTKFCGMCGAAMTVSPVR